MLQLLATFMYDETNEAANASVNHKPTTFLASHAIN